MASSEGASVDTTGTSSGTSSGTSAPSGTASGLPSGRQPRGEIPGPSAAEGAEVESGIRFSCLMNARYHASREAFLDNVHRWFMFTVIVLGAGALIDVGVKEFPWAKEAFGAFAAIIAALDLTFDLSNRARTHALMKRRYFELLADFNEGKKKPEETRACIDRYCADEEPAYHALLASSWNAAQEMLFGNNAQRYAIPWSHHVSQNFLRHGVRHYKLDAKPTSP